MTGAEAIQQLIEVILKRVPVSVSVGTVKDVDKAKRTCTVEREERPALFNCRLNSIIDNYTDHVTAFPKIDSYVLCVVIGEQTDTYVLATSEVEEVAVKIGSSELKANKDGWVFNGGDLGGMVKLEALTNKINTIESDINNLKTIFTAWVPATQDGGGALKTAATAWAGQQITATQKADIENNKIKQ